jgi:cysteine desulfuration protein SufE
MDMFESCLGKQRKVLEVFRACQSQDEKYQKIMDLGRLQHPLKPQDKIPANVVKGCQSTMYLHSYIEKGLIFFEAESEALISSGLASILIQVYNGEPPEVILKCPPRYLEELDLSASLTPSRANGLYSIHLRMKQDALKFLVG